MEKMIHTLFLMTMRNQQKKLKLNKPKKNNNKTKDYIQQSFLHKVLVIKLVPHNVSSGNH